MPIRQGRLNVLTLLLFTLAVTGPGAATQLHASPADRALEPRLEEATRRMSHPAAGLAALKQVYLSAHRTGADSVEGISLLRIAQLELNHDLARVTPILDASESIWNRRRDEANLARVMVVAAERDRRTGAPLAALAGLERAATQLGATAEAARTWLACAALDLDCDDPVGRLRHLEFAERAALASRDSLLARSAMRSRARLLADMGETAKSAELFARTMTAGPGASERARTSLHRAASAVGAGKLEDAARELQHARPELFPREDRDAYVSLLESEATVAWLRGFPQPAAAVAGEMFAEATRGALIPAQARACMLLGRLALAGGDLAGARRFALLCLTRARVSVNSEAAAHLLLGRVALRESELPRAKGELGTARALALRCGAAEVEAGADEGLGDLEAIEQRDATASLWYALARGALRRGSGAGWKLEGSPGVPWTTEQALLRRSLNLEMQDPRAEAGWDRQEDARAQQLLDVLAGSASARLARWLPSERARALELAGLRASLGTRGDDAPAMWDSLVATLDSLQEKVDRRMRQELEILPANLEALRRALPKGRTLVSYSLSPATACAWVVWADSVCRVTLGASSELSNLLEMQAGDTSLSGGDVSAPRPTGLGGSIAAVLPRSTRDLVVVADPPLARLPEYLAGTTFTGRNFPRTFFPSAGCWLTRQDSRGRGVQRLPFPREARAAQGAALLGRGLRLLREGTPLVLVQVRPGVPGVPDAWIAVFDSCMKAGRGPGMAAVTAEAGSRPGAVAPGRRAAYVLVGITGDPGAGRGQPLLSPWVAGLAAAAALVALFALVLGVFRNETGPE